MSVTERPLCQARNPATVDHPHGSPMDPSSGMSWAAYSSRCAGSTGAGDSPSDPQTRLVTPPRSAISQVTGMPCSPTRVPPRAPWLCVSTKLGASTRPCPSITRSAPAAPLGVTSPSWLMRSPSINASPS